MGRVMPHGVYGSRRGLVISPTGSAGLVFLNFVGVRINDASGDLLAIDENRYVAVREHFPGLTAEEKAGYAAASVSADHD